jgi:hypothetical protein
MKFSDAYIQMVRGKKIRRKGWIGFWAIPASKNTEIYMTYRFFKDEDYGEIQCINIKDTTDMVLTLSHTLCNDWEVI